MRLRETCACIASALAVLVASSAALGQTSVNDVNSAALVGPFDETEGHKTYLTAHGPMAVSPSSGLPQVVTHWTFWSETCAHLADFYVCLTKDDSVVIDVSDMGGVGPDNEQLTSRLDLSGYRGLFTVHSFESGLRCRDAEEAGFVLVPESINGTWTIASTRTNAAFGDRAQSMELDPTGAFVAVPDERFGAVDLPFFNPDSLSASQVILLTVVENFGDLAGEIGPPQGLLQIGGQVKACDNQENCISLPDAVIGCALFSTLIPSPGALIPETLMPGSGGFLRLSSPRFIVNDDPSITGDDVWIYTFHGQQLGPFGTGARGTYSQQFEPTPTPSPTASPVPSATPEGTPTLPTMTPGPTPTPGGPTPTATGTPGATPTGPTATPGGATPTPGTSPTPTPAGTVTPLPTPSPGAPTQTPASSATPAATPTSSATPVPTQLPAPTPTVFGP